jgi:hypothetical protein
MVDRIVKSDEILFQFIPKDKRLREQGFVFATFAHEAVQLPQGGVEAYRSVGNVLGLCFWQFTLVLFICRLVFQSC